MAFEIGVEDVLEQPSVLERSRGRSRCRGFSMERRSRGSGSPPPDRMMHHLRWPGEVQSVVPHPIEAAQSDDPPPLRSISGLNEVSGRRWRRRRRPWMEQTQRSGEIVDAATSDRHVRLGPRIVGVDAHDPQARSRRRVAVSLRASRGALATRSPRVYETFTIHANCPSLKRNSGPTFNCKARESRGSESTLGSGPGPSVRRLGPRTNRGMRADAGSRGDHPNVARARDTDRRAFSSVPRKRGICSNMGPETDAARRRRAATSLTPRC